MIDSGGVLPTIRFKDEESDSEHFIRTAFIPPVGTVLRLRALRKVARVTRCEMEIFGDPLGDSPCRKINATVFYRTEIWP